jgi:hypothetical protein
MSRKTDGELLAMLGSPADSTPEALDAAKIELWKRHIPGSRGNGRGFGDVPLKTPLSSLAVYSLVLCLLPYVGLPMAFAALRRISQSEGRLSGRNLAWVSIIVNTVSLLIWLSVIALTVVLGMLGQ